MTERRPPATGKNSSRTFRRASTKGRGHRKAEVASTWRNDTARKTDPKTTAKEAGPERGGRLPFGFRQSLEIAGLELGRHRPSQDGALSQDFPVGSRFHFHLGIDKLP